jgi:hypothetical protein
MSDQMTSIHAPELTDEALLEICRAAEVTACECPGYLASILRQIRTFHAYTLNCIEEFPEGKETHIWLAAQAEIVQKLLWKTTVELMRREGLIDAASNRIILDRIKERAQQTALRQIERRNGIN